MPHAKLDAYFESGEFPNLAKNVGNLRRKIIEIRILRVDREFVTSVHRSEHPIMNCQTIDDIRLLDLNGHEVGRVNQYPYYKVPVVLWKPWTYWKYSPKRFYPNQAPTWFYDETQTSLNIQSWMDIRSYPDIAYVLHFKIAKEGTDALVLHIRKVPKKWGSLQMSLAFLKIEEQRELRLRQEPLFEQIHTEIANVDAEPNSD